ncbi:MAG: hypothetical protein IJD30_05550 [Clostridia bacterium]|nr:hypothetical protein [Clostridia bacterium]
MKNLSKQVVILDSISSPYIHQAIIILKSYPPGQHDKIIAEAERIVSSYFDRRAPDTNACSDNKILKSAVIFLSIALFVSSYFAFIK